MQDCTETLLLLLLLLATTTTSSSVVGPSSLHDMISLSLQLREDIGKAQYRHWTNQRYRRARDRNNRVHNSAELASCTLSGCLSVEKRHTHTHTHSAVDTRQHPAPIMFSRGQGRTAMTHSLSGGPPPAVIVMWTATDSPPRPMTQRLAVIICFLPAGSSTHSPVRRRRLSDANVRLVAWRPVAVYVQAAAAACISY